VSAPGDYDIGEIGGMIGRENRSTRRKPATVLLCPPQTPHAARTRTRAAAMGNQRLTTELRHGLDKVCYILTIFRKCLIIFARFDHKTTSYIKLNRSSIYFVKLSRLFKNLHGMQLQTVLNILVLQQSKSVRFYSRFN
jgi:hypothetical protein